MKTVKKQEEVRRVSDKVATELVDNNGWKYCPKSEVKKKEAK